MERSKKGICWFGVTLLILTIVFRYLKTYSLDQQSLIMTGILGIVYCISIPILAWGVGGKNFRTHLFLKTGMLYNLTAFIIYVIISELWHILGFASQYEYIFTIHRTAFLWGLGVIIHLIIYLYSRKYTIKDYQKEDIFD